MERLIIRSELISILPYDQIMQICFSSARLNMRSNITGFMVECGGVFIQSLEGTPNSLSKTFRRIVKDKRHHRIKRIFLNKNADSRIFGAWSMNMMFLDDQSLWQQAIGSLDAYDGFHERSHDAAFAIGVLMLSYRHACEKAQLSSTPSEDRCGQLPHPDQVLGA
ncbi:BLUF domain-containing protein [Azospirillum sp. TSA6c]|uniref:BLUF domain-containing protein n=1 Tax=Azospirillum sp. TSA6c TaxID=709813 RepID=UPI000D652E5C|nr:BLUF domain-containing protein [Azospirillum sp. TSA6c]